MLTQNHVSEGGGVPDDHNENPNGYSHVFQLPVPNTIQLQRSI